MDYLFQDGGKPKKTKSKTGSKTTKSKTTKSKTSTKTGTKTTKSKTSTKKGGNFLGTVGDLVAPAGWETFATTAGLLALDRADAALRRGKSEKSSAKKGGMRGGNPSDIEATRLLQNSNQEIVNKYQKNLNEAFRQGKQSDPIIYGLNIQLENQIQERARLLDFVSDENIKKKLKSSIKRLEQRLSQEIIRVHRSSANTLRRYNHPNSRLNFTDK